LVRNFPPDDPSRQGAIEKQVVVLQNHTIFPKKKRTSMVLTTTNLIGREVPWNVFVSAGTFEPWKSDCVIQCGDIFSWLVADLTDGKLSVYRGVLPGNVMRRVDIALAVSLSLGPGR
jgi:mRNA-degrading endonuclease toxin of MazEF toxin-antitoxin module